MAQTQQLPKMDVLMALPSQLPALGPEIAMVLMALLMALAVTLATLMPKAVATAMPRLAIQRLVAKAWAAHQASKGQRLEVRKALPLEMSNRQMVVGGQQQQNRRRPHPQPFCLVARTLHRLNPSPTTNMEAQKQHQKEAHVQALATQPRAFAQEVSKLPAQELGTVPGGPLVAGLTGTANVGAHQKAADSLRSAGGLLVSEFSYPQASPLHGQLWSPFHD
mmetsp:Transcript_17174/g.36429  ORF Transcript_17174/g.36429 Transcript_17174/m.36429 type:complete len:221 (+) Transcript_17174:793-1455(+)|eukprot:CAMPEP_0180657492 /NCGR_PEP_ID=MMETSP1037_2-20121125/56456_1 /TAXON_ID=632150 /ORGANISM="Azadinium spinosum, Strain 3D9" /LENGTH=220 /DNA_ID=CAMNT_0022684229 /DNA_START=770 /DNA_END=1432 /DNA_ORIENTATION=+